MNATLAVRPEARLARPLKVLAPLIEKDLQNEKDAGIEHRRAAGEKLREAKYQCMVEGKRWINWLNDNFKMSKTTAFDYMRLAESIEFEQAFSDEQDSDEGRAPQAQPTGKKTVTDYTRPGRNKSHRPAWYEQVSDAVDNLNVARMRQEQLDKQNEEKLQRELGLKLIDIGYKALATKLHPDKGGSADAMVRLQTVREKLKGAI